MENKNKQKITPHLWFDKEAKEAAEFYVSIFPDSEIKQVSTLHDTPSGDCDIVSFSICEFGFMAISAGPLFKINPSISFHVRCRSAEEVDRYSEKLSEGGKALMPLGSYPFSERYAWIEDRFGVSWQIIYTDKEFSQKIVPAFMFTQDVSGRTKEAIEHYTKVFPESEIKSVLEYGKNEFNEKEENVMYSEFILMNEEFIAMDSGAGHNFKFNEAISFIVNCDTQEEVDYYWELSAVRDEEQCGWLKDKFGVSWQIVPSILGEMMADEDKEKVARVTQAFLKMRKFDIAKLKEAYEKS
ncbi:MAG: VOC family protein [Nanoarchaeota archaeon]|nr:VOC family protein [Nanoarchaeota archaeon]